LYIDAKQVGYKIYTSERDAHGVRRVKSHPIRYEMYFEAPDGPFRSIDGAKLRKYETGNRKDLREVVKDFQARNVRVFESDIDPVNRLLELLYPGEDGPELNIHLIDIEVDKDPKRGFSRVDYPYAEINAVTIYDKANKETLTLVVPPPNLTMQQTQDLLEGKCYQNVQGEIIDTPQADDDWGPLNNLDGYFVVEDEKQLLILLIQALQNADVISGWNSMFFDLPYIIQRIRIVLGGEDIDILALEDGSEEHPYRPSDESRIWLDQLCLFPCPPSMRMVEHYGNMEKTYNLHGRIHLDYLDLYRKFTYEELHSYSLDAILRHEVKQKKIPYEGSLDQLYRWDIRRFTAYNRQDVMGLNAIDDKRRMINLANSMAHMAGVTLDKVLGSVAIIEQAILKELHKQGLICFDRGDKARDYPIPGAFVLEPQKGLYHWLAGYDFNSLYPTVLRMLNISPECIVGFLENSETINKLMTLIASGMDSAEAWSHFPGTIEYNRVIDRSSEAVTFIIEDLPDDDPDKHVVMTGAEMHDVITENEWVITAFGLILHRDQQGIIPFCLEKWYLQRKDFQKKMAQAKDRLESTEVTQSNDPDVTEKVKVEIAYYDMRQQVQKIFLNSTYGALLNAFCLFYDPRMGASVTMSGRVCLAAMAAHAEHLLENEVV
jgi:DNA polymerase elongation subunit (family B)